MSQMNALTRLCYQPIWRYHLTARKMSYEVSLSKLPSPLKDLVTNAQADAGKTDNDKLEVVSWIDKVAAGEIVKSERFSVSSSARRVIPN